MNSVVVRKIFAHVFAGAVLDAIAVARKTKFSMLFKEIIFNGANINTKRRKGRIFIILTCFFLLLIFIILILENTEKPNIQESGDIFFNEEIMIKNAKIFVAIADNPAARDRGLSGLSHLKENQGMLFLFNEPGIYGFWMKDMNFDIDFIWMHNNKIVEITENAQASHYPENLKTYFPSKIINSVLEVNAGWAQKNNIEVGDEIKKIGI